MMRAVKVFICYSRAQFYFAEDVALALMQRGIDAWFDVHRISPADDWDSEIDAAVRACDALLLVASPAAFGSRHARAEQDLARKLGKPFVVVLADRVELPGALGAAPLVDLRRGFDEKVRSLTAVLEAWEFATPTSGVLPKRRARAGVVRMVAGALLAQATLWGLTSIVLVLKLALSSPGPGVVAARGFSALPFGAVFIVLFAAFCGWLRWAFLRRRPGSAMVLGVTIVLALGTIVFFWLSYYGLFVVPRPLNATAAVTFAVMLSLLGASGVAGIWALRSPSFYRWLPTGDAPGWMRRRMLVRRGHRTSVQPSSVVAITYDISCHELDSSVEEALDRALQVGGHRRVDRSSAERQIVVVSNLTPANSLPSPLTQPGGRVVAVISAPVSLAVLEDVERFQWVDHRRRTRRTLDHLAATIGGDSQLVGADLVPEAMARRVLPRPVAFIGGLFVIVGAVDLALGIAGLAGTNAAETYGGSGSTWRSLAELLLAGALWSIAGALVGRRIPLRYYFPSFALILAASVATALLSANPPTSSVVETMAGLPVMLFIGWKAGVGWLPPRIARGTELAVAGHVWWRRPAGRGVALFGVVLTLAFLFTIPPFARTLNARKPAIPTLAPISTVSGVGLPGHGYALESPPGWSKATLTVAGFDLALAPDDSQVHQLVTVFRRRAPRDAGLAELQAVRDRVRDAIAPDVTSATLTELDGETSAITFSYRLDGAQGRVRQVVALHRGVAYEIALTVGAGSYLNARRDFTAILRSWRWAA